MHYVTSKGILSASNGMNLYRGCTHGCIYCDSRSDCYHMNHAFEDIEVKQNALELLEDALKRKRKRCMIGTGAMTDPYIPLENDLRYVRKSLSLAEKYGFGFTLITKSTQVLRDLDILKKINEKTKCVVQMTLTTYDEQFRAYCTMVIVGALALGMTTTAFAANDPLTVVNNLSDFIFGLIRAIGMILLGFGIVQVGLSLKSHDPSQRANGFLRCISSVRINLSGVGTIIMFSDILKSREKL